MTIGLAVVAGIVGFYAIRNARARVRLLPDVAEIHGILRNRSIPFREIAIIEFRLRRRSTKVMLHSDRSCIRLSFNPAEALTFVDSLRQRGASFLLVDWDSGHLVASHESPAGSLPDAQRLASIAIRIRHGLIIRALAISAATTLFGLYIALSVRSTPDCYTGTAIAIAGPILAFFWCRGDLGLLRQLQDRRTRDAGR